MNHRESFRKNKDDITGILLRTYPEFVFKSIDTLNPNEIPVFVFHSIRHDKFEKQLKYLSDNNYKTINSDCFYEIIIGNKKNNEKNIVLTFDDGLGSLWSSAYPLLKKYGFTAVSFLVPSLIIDDDKYYPNLEDYWNKKASIEEILQREETSPLCTWEEIKTIHNSGVIDFQSHSFFHCSIFINNWLVDFINPKFKPSFLKSSLNPLIFKDGKEILIDAEQYGFPIYKWNANLASKTRYVEDESVSHSCMEFVKENGGERFFNKPNWRTLLHKHWKESSFLFEKKKKFQTLEERKEDIKKELSESKIEIENKLNKNVYHFCYPWYNGSDLSVNISKEAGYKSNYWGTIKGNAINTVGDDPFYFKRINENYIFSLPGKGRKSFLKLFSSKVISEI